jgi:heme exporter protein D
VLLAENGFLSAGVDDVLRLVILALAAVNVVVLLAAVRTLRQSTRILLDVEQFARQVRKETREHRERAGTDM